MQSASAVFIKLFGEYIVLMKKRSINEEERYTRGNGESSDEFV